jgi:hypothetical protein
MAWPPALLCCPSLCLDCCAMGVHALCGAIVSQLHLYGYALLVSTREPRTFAWLGICASSKILHCFDWRGLIGAYCNRLDALLWISKQAWHDRNVTFPSCSCAQGWCAPNHIDVQSGTAAVRVLACRCAKGLLGRESTLLLVISIQTCSNLKRFENVVAIGLKVQRMLHSLHLENTYLDHT